MLSPYIVLGVPETADDQVIRRAYLDGIRNSPPEQDPAGFQRISDAYKLIQNEESRLKYYLGRGGGNFETPIDAFTAFCANAPLPSPLPFEAMKEFLRSSTKI